MSSLHVTHEIDSQGLYTLTVSDMKTGALHFAWTVPAEDGLSVANTMLSTIEEWMMDSGRGNPYQADSPTPGEVWPDPT